VSWERGSSGFQGLEGYFGNSLGQLDPAAIDLHDGGDWNSLAMPSRYVEAAKRANEGVKLGED
jgi:hypothetical protein